jgi:hypothetical protein
MTTTLMFISKEAMENKEAGKSYVVWEEAGSLTPKEYTTIHLEIDLLNECETLLDGEDIAGYIVPPQTTLSVNQLKIVWSQLDSACGDLENSIHNLRNLGLDADHLSNAFEDAVSQKNKVEELIIAQGGEL